MNSIAVKKITIVMDINSNVWQQIVVFHEHGFVMEISIVVNLIDLMKMYLYAILKKNALQIIANALVMKRKVNVMWHSIGRKKLIKLYYQLGTICIETEKFCNEHFDCINDEYTEYCGECSVRWNSKIAFTKIKVCKWFVFHWKSDNSTLKADCVALNCSYGCNPTPSGAKCYCINGQQPNGTLCEGFYNHFILLIFAFSFNSDQRNDWIYSDNNINVYSK